MANVVFDEDSAARIAKAVKYVEGLQNPEQPGEEEVVEQSGRTVIRGQFTGEWAKNTAKDVSFTADNGDSGTKSATNYLADVGAEGETSACCIIKAGSEWVLVSASPVTECIELSKIEPSGNLTLLSDINPTGSVVTKLCGSVVTALSGSVVTQVECVNGNLVVTTDSLGNLACSTLAANLATTANLSDAIVFTETKVSLESFANITTQNYTLPKQQGCE